jgi:hypothetical protein
MPEISDFQHTNSEFAKFEKKISRQDHFSISTLIFPSGQRSSETMYYHQRDIFRKKLTKFDLWIPASEPWYLVLV